MCTQYLKSISLEQKNWIENEKIKKIEFEAEGKKPLKKRGKVY